MILYINTASHEEIIIALFKADLSSGSKAEVSFSYGADFKVNTGSRAGANFNDKSQLIVRQKIKAPRQQAEKLLPAIDRMLRTKKIKLNAIKKIVVVNRGGSFTSLRIGVLTANALGYALKIPVVSEFARAMPKLTDSEVKKNGLVKIEIKKDGLTGLTGQNKKTGKKLTKTEKKFGVYSLVEPVYDQAPMIGNSKKDFRG